MVPVSEQALSNRFELGNPLALDRQERETSPNPSTGETLYDDALRLGEELNRRPLLGGGVECLPPLHDC